jgi:heme exporter protein C
MAATAERALGKATSRNGERTLGVASLVALAISAVLSLVVAPPDAVQGEVQRIMYVHVPAPGSRTSPSSSSSSRASRT